MQTEDLSSAMQRAQRLMDAGVISANTPIVQALKNLLKSRLN